jgi:UDP-N-acetylmuramoylalanine--D-glutamate ligase
VVREWSEELVVIIGAARQGIALARYVLDHGGHVRITDRLQLAELGQSGQDLAAHDQTGRLEWAIGEHPMTLLDGATMLCPSGGVPLTLPLVQEAVRRGIPLSNDSQLFLEAAPCKVVGITGSAGKTTTTVLVGRMAQAGSGAAAQAPFQKAWVGGNIGAPLISQVDSMQSSDLAIMELSSFQLEIMSRSPQVAAILNITPNHLDRHSSFEEYAHAKTRMIAHQTSQDTAVLGRDDPAAWSLQGQVRGQLVSFGLSKLPGDQAGCFLDRETICLRMPVPAEDRMQEYRVMPRTAVLLRGEHNLLNVMAACSIAASVGLPVSAMRVGVDGFMGVPHRLEFVRSWGGADWYNDSIATAPERAIAAIRSFSEPLVLLAGGRDKDLPWDSFARLVCSRVDHLIVFGEAAGVILQALEAIPEHQPGVVRCKGLQEAVLEAARLVEPGDVVLLSPGGTSFDEFRDFEERGECFARWVNDLQ